MYFCRPQKGPILFMHSNFNTYFLKASGASACEEIEVIQPLWSGYGKISRYLMKGSVHKTLVVKKIILNEYKEHPKGWNTDIGHQRKVTSYKIETHWYQKWSPACNAHCRIPEFIGSYTAGDEKWIILEDLNGDFPVRKQTVTHDEIKSCLKWLANFHANFLNQKPVGLWPIGTYWHLATRPDEYKKIKHTELKAKAHLIDAQLNNCRFKTLVHGDAKLANFCFAETENQDKGVAAVDFQYVGGGCGMKDIAYFLGSCLSGEACQKHESDFLNFYFSALQNALSPQIEEFNFQELENEWRRMYPMACADFTRFLLGWMPTHQKINDYQLKILESVLSDL